MSEVKIVKRGQSVVDLSLQYYGSLEGMFDIAFLNGISITRDLVPGSEILVNPVKNNTTVYLDKYKITIAASELNQLNYLHPYTILYRDHLIAQANPLSDNEVLWLDRLVRDLNGYPNGDYDTVNQWDDLIAVFPMPGDIIDKKKYDLINPSGTHILSIIGSVTVDNNGFATNGVDSFVNTHVIEGTETDENDICFGVYYDNYVDNAAPEQSFVGAGNDNFGTFLETTVGQYHLTTVGDSHAHVQGGDVVNEGLLHGESESEDMAIFLDGINMVAEAQNEGPNPLNTPFYLGANNNGVSPEKHLQATFGFAYFGKYPADIATRKALWNSINYYLWQRGVRNSFNAIV